MIPKIIKQSIKFLFLCFFFTLDLYFPVLQIKRDNRDNLGIISHISPLNIFCDLSLELSHRDGSNEGPQHMFSLRKNKKSYL